MARPFFEKHEHGDKCSQGVHLPYRIRTPSWIEVHCKVCYDIDIEFYEKSTLKPPTIGEAVA